MKPNKNARPQYKHHSGILAHPACSSSATHRHNKPCRSFKKYLIQFKQFKQVLEDHFWENKTANYYAEQLHITQHHLNLICKAITNNTATDIIRARSILEAKRLLTFTDKSIAEIAFELNFSDGSYFAKTFKSFTNHTPQDFRSKMSEKYRTR
nr:helix-turn-helix transcriptional regulator [Haliscomenobacter sp.]